MSRKLVLYEKGTGTLVQICIRKPNENQKCFLIKQHMCDFYTKYSIFSEYYENQTSLPTT